MSSCPAQDNAVVVNLGCSSNSACLAIRSLCPTVERPSMEVQDLEVSLVPLASRTSRSWVTRGRNLEFAHNPLGCFDAGEVVC